MKAGDITSRVLLALALQVRLARTFAHDHELCARILVARLALRCTFWNGGIGKHR